MAAKVAQELYDNDTAVPLLTEDRLKSFKKRYDNATAQEIQMTEAIKKMMNVSKNYPGMHPLIMAVLTPARSIYKLAPDAENDAKSVVLKRVFTEMLAERIESLQALIKDEKTAPEVACADKTSRTDNKAIDVTEVSKHRDAAAKAYLSAASAERIAAVSVDRIKGNRTQADATYYELKELLAKVRREDYEGMHVYQSIADKAHADTEECEEVAVGAPDYAKAFVETAKAHLNNITSCVDADEAKWHAREAQKASQKALDEMQYALYRLFQATVSLRQLTDAKKAVAASKALKDATEDETKFAVLEKNGTLKKIREAKKEHEAALKANAVAAKENADTGAPMPKMVPMKEKSEEEKAMERIDNDAAVREAKKKAVKSEKEAEKAYEAVKVHADKAFNTVQHVADIVNQVKELAAQVPGDQGVDKKSQMEVELTKATKALQSANESSSKAQAAAAAVYDQYNKTKNAVDTALQAFDQNAAEHYEKTATELAETTKKSTSTGEQEAKEALGNVEKEKAGALAAYHEMNKLVEALGKEKGFSILKLQAARASDRDSATVLSLLPVSVAVLCAMAFSMLSAV